MKLKKLKNKLTPVLLVVLLIVQMFLPVQVFFNPPKIEIQEVKAVGENWASGYLYRKAITIDHTKVSGSSNLTNFPVLVNITSDNDLRTTGNGGHVQNANGYDIIFTDSTGGTKLDHEIEKYVSTTGELVAHVRVPVLDYSNDTIIYLYYGNSGISASQENINGTWDANYKMVQHLDETSGTHNDSTSNANNGTANGGVTQDAAGKIDGADNFDGTDDYLSVADAASLDITDQITVEAWMDPSTDGWKYKKPITLSPATPEDNYQVKVELNTSNFDYSKAKTNGEDLRFYQADGTSLDYWIETWNTSGTSTIWVEVATNNTGTIYMYYGNPSASSVSNGTNTFEFFDDFEEKDTYVLSDTYIANSSSGDHPDSACRLPRQRNSFYANERYWFFYSNYSSMKIEYVTSVDGESWSSATEVASFPRFSADWTIYFDGTYLHYVRNTGNNPTSHAGLVYRRGIPNVDGSITWSAAEQTIYDETHEYGDMDLVVDSNGYPWVGYGYDNTLPQIIKSSTNDGTWVTASDFPHDFDKFDSIDTFSVLAPLSDGKMYVLTYPWTSTAKYKGYYWNGSSWSDEGEIVTSTPADIYVSPVDILGYNDEVHLVFLDSDGRIVYRKRLSDGTWLSEVEIDDGSHTSSESAKCTSPVICIDPSDGNLFVFWQDYTAGKIYMVKQESGVWQETVEVLSDIVTETSDYCAHTMVYEKVGNGKMGLSYLNSDDEIHHCILYTTVQHIAQSDGDNPAGWTVTNSGTNNDAVISSSHAKRGSKSVRVYSSITTTKVGLIKYIDYTKFVVDADIYTHQLSANEGGDNNDNVPIVSTQQDTTDAATLLMYGDGPQWGYYNGSHNKSGDTFSLDTWYKVTAIYNANSSKVSFYVDENAVYENVDFYHSVTSLNRLRFGTGGQDHLWDFYVDDVRIRKYASSEPVATIGNEIAAGISKAGSYGIGANTTSAFASINNQTISGGTLSLGWNHIALTYNKDAGSNQMNLYLNGASVAQGTLTDAIETNTNDLWIGDLIASAGISDEIRVSATARSADWIATGYNNQSDPSSFYSVGDEIVDTTNPAVFDLSSPSNNSYTNNNTPTLSWSASSDSESELAKYQLYIDGSLDTDNISSSATSTTPANNLSCGSHTWYVKAIDNAGNSTSSSTFNLTIACGSGLPSSAYNPPSQPKPTPENPENNFSVVINNNDEYTSNQTVTLKLNAGSDTKRMAISNNPDFKNASQIPYQEEIEWDLLGNPPSPLLQRGNTYTVYVKFYTQYGVASGVVSDSIILKTGTNSQKDNQGTGDNNNPEDSNQQETPDMKTSSNQNNPQQHDQTESAKQSSVIFTQTLKFNSNNNQVVNLQNKLKELNFFPKEIKSNGNFGPTTKQAVIDYQKSKGIYPCGIVGPRTRKALNNQEFITNKDYQFTQDLKYNDKNEEVKQLQTRLRDRNLFPYYIKSTGWFGSITERAVRLFQKFYKLVENGIVGEEMRKELNR